MKMFSCRCGWRMPESNVRAVAAHKAGRDGRHKVTGSKARPRIAGIRSDGAKTMQRYRCQLFTVNPHCYWCGRLTIWHNPPDGILQPESATVDHIVSRYNRGWNAPTDIVLACFECNQRRCQNETSARLESRRQIGIAGEDLGQ